MTPMPASSVPVPHAPPAFEAGAELRVPVLAETVVLTKERIETGRVRLTKTVSEHAETLPLDLRHDEVQTERVALNQVLAEDAPAPESRYEGDTLVIPVVREVLVKRLLLVEEVRVTRRQAVRPAPQTVTLRREEVRVERLPVAPTEAGHHEAGA